MLDNPLLILPEPSSVLAVLISESDTSPAVVNLLAAKTLVARHKGRTGQSATSTVVRAGVIVVGHVFLSLFRSCECVLYHAAAVLVNP